MNIGVLKELKPDEKRVALQPIQVKTLVEIGHTVYVESNAGIRASYDDEQYKKFGAIISNKKNILDMSQLILKIKVPLISEYSDYCASHILFAYLHFDENISSVNINRLIQSGFMGIAYEWIEENGHYPLLEPMSRLTGYLFAQKSIELCTKYKGILCGRHETFSDGAIAMIIGLGNIGISALNYFLVNKLNLIIVDKHPETINDRINKRFQTVHIDYIQQYKIKIIKFDNHSPLKSKKEIADYLPKVDIILNCAVRRPNLPKEKLPYLIDTDMIKMISPGSVVCDTTACDNDLIQTCVSSEFLEKYDIIHDVIHYNCDHIPSYVSKTSTKILTGASFPYIMDISNKGIEAAIRENEGLQRGVSCYKGRVTHQYTAEKKGFEYNNIMQLI
jgi:alanine dehydrogenase